MAGMGMGAWDRLMILVSVSVCARKECRSHEPTNLLLSILCHVWHKKKSHQVTHDLSQPSHPLAMYIMTVSSINN